MTDYDEPSQMNRTGTFPSWCKSYKVICISGGRGGSGADDSKGFATNGGRIWGYGTVSENKTYTVNIGKPGERFSQRGDNFTYPSDGDPTLFNYPGISWGNSNSEIDKISVLNNYGIGGKNGGWGAGKRGGPGYCRVYYFTK